jgi:hypothetical protein
MLLPKIHRNNMLPRMWPQLPWMNIDVRVVRKYGAIAHDGA